MGIASAYIAPLDLTVNVWDGLVTIDDWLELARKQTSDPHFSPGHRRITDALSADPASRLTVADADRVAQYYAEHGLPFAPTKLAIVAARGWRVAGRTKGSLGPLGVTTMVFLTVREACIWLGIDDYVPVADKIAELRAQLRADREQAQRNAEQSRPDTGAEPPGSGDA